MAHQTDIGQVHSLIACQILGRVQFDQKAGPVLLQLRVQIREFLLREQGHDGLLLFHVTIAQHR